MRLIDADALMEKLEAWKKEAERINANINYTFASAIMAQVNAEPTIEERKTGKWIIEPYDAQNDIFIHRCGTCMRVAMLGGHTTKFKYCPICGSAMEGEQSVTD